MSLPPQKFREIVFQLLYSQDFVELDQEEYIPFVMKLLLVTRRAVTEACQKVLQIASHGPEIDELIRQSSTNYSFDRISRVERTALRLGIFEILFDEGIPPKVAIAEAIRLCRKFGTPEGAHFVNAVLDDIYTKQPQPV